MADNNNDFLLIILIGVIIFWIFNINKKPVNNYETENFVIPSSDTQNPTQNPTPTLQSQQTPISNTQLYSNNISSNPTPDILAKPATLYSELSAIDSTKNESSINDSYMLLPPNNIPDEKFNKVMSQEPARQVLASGDLLPKDENKDWFQVPNSKFDLMQAVNLEVPEIKIGVDTVGQSRKNASYDLRAAPPNPKFVVSPWSNSTIEPDYNIKSLC